MKTDVKPDKKVISVGDCSAIHADRTTHQPIFKTATGKPFKVEIPESR